MGAIDNKTYAAARTYTNQVLVGGGAIKGKNATIDGITDIPGGHRVTFKWTLDNGTVQTNYMDVKDGSKIVSITADSQNRIVVTMEDGTSYTTATVPTVKGDSGFSPIASAERINNGTKITITDESGTTQAIAQDGVSPQVSVVRNPQNDGVIITIIDADGSHTANVYDGDAEHTVIDTALSLVSTNAVQNKAITEEVRATQSSLNDALSAIGENTSAIMILNGNSTVNGSVDKKISDALSNLDRLTKQIVTELPDLSEAIENVIYLIENTAGTAYDQYTIVDDGAGGKEWALLGSTDTDLTGYYTSVQVDSLLNDKQPTLTGATTSFNSLNAMANRAIVSNANGKLAVSPITATELESLDDITGNVQDQLDAKQDTLEYDDRPRENSTKNLTSGVVYTALDDLLSAAEAYTDSAISNFGGFEVVESLEDVTSPNTKTIYLVKDSTVTADDKYKEYIYIIVGGVGHFEMIGDVTFQMSIATTSEAGIVMPDGDTIEVAADGGINVDPKFKRSFIGTKAEWEALTVPERKTYNIVNITDDETGTPEYYSTEEVKTNKVWIDGKPIYRRIIAITSPSTTAETNVSIAELGFTDIDKIFIIPPSYIYLYINNLNQHVPITLGWGSGDLGIIPSTDDSHNGYLVWKVGNSAWTSKNGYVTLMYTKTTD